jgi:hypothetical protein
MTVRVNVKLMSFLYHAQQLLLYLLAPFHMPVPVLSFEMTRSASYPQPLRRRAQPSLPLHSFTHCTNRMQGLNRRGCPAVALASEVGWATLKIDITNHKTAQTSARSIRVAGRTLPSLAFDPKSSVDVQFRQPLQRFARPADSSRGLAISLRIHRQQGRASPQLFSPCIQSCFKRIFR